MSASDTRRSLQGGKYTRRSLTGYPQPSPHGSALSKYRESPHRRIPARSVRHILRHTSLGVNSSTAPGSDVHSGMSSGTLKARTSIEGANLHQAEPFRTIFLDSRPHRSQVPTRLAFAAEPGTVWSSRLLLRGRGPLQFR